MNMWNVPVAGTEEVIVCRDCRERSDRDLRGRDGFTLVIRGGGAIPVCKECAAVEQWGQPGQMARLIRDTRAACSAPGFRPVPRLSLVSLPMPTERPGLRVVCFPAVVVAQPSDETWHV